MELSNREQNAFVTDDAIGKFRDFTDFQFRIGYSPACTCTCAPAAAAATSSAPPPTVANRPPTVVARCEPCTVEVGRTSTVTADASDRTATADLSLDGAGRNAQVAADRQTIWTAPQQ